MNKFKYYIWLVFLACTMQNILFAAQHKLTKSEFGGPSHCAFRPTHEEVWIKIGPNCVKKVSRNSNTGYFVLDGNTHLGEEYVRDRQITPDEAFSILRRLKPSPDEKKFTTDSFLEEIWIKKDPSRGTSRSNIRKMFSVGSLYTSDFITYYDKDYVASRRLTPEEEESVRIREAPYHAAPLHHMLSADNLRSHNKKYRTTNDSPHAHWFDEQRRLFDNGECAAQECDSVIE